MQASQPESADNVVQNSSVSPAASQSVDEAPSSSRPVARNERIGSIDVLRGFALMGVLLMNMQAFAFPFCAYINPTSIKQDDSVDFAFWLVNHVIADGKFITIFSMLFGAGIVLMTSRAKARTGKSIGLHYRRMFWMILFGATHGILIWYGDILFTYGLCGLLAYWFRNRSATLLTIISVLLITIPALLMSNFEKFVDEMPPDEQAMMLEMWAPPPDVLAEQIAAYQGGYTDHLPHRFQAWTEMFSFLMFFGWRLLGAMLLGMAFFKSRIFSARRSDGFYMTMIILGFGMGLPLAAYGVYYNNSHGWLMKHSFGVGSLFNYFGSLFSAFGWIGLVMLVCRRDVLGWLRQRFAAVGQMAFTNYIMQSLICTTIFYGHGLGFFGNVSRPVQLLLVIAIGVLQLWYSPLWLKRFRFGPLEWLWRSLSYWRKQPMSRAQTSL